LIASRFLLIAALALALVAPVIAAPLHLPVEVRYGAPAGTLPVEHLPGRAFDAVLPSGRIVTPSGTSVVTGMNALGAALTPDGRYAIVSNDDERDGSVRSMIDPAVTGGYALTVVETATMHVVSRFSAPNATYFAGVAAFADPANPAKTLVLAAGGGSNAVYVFSLAANGTLVPDRNGVIAIGGPFDPLFANDGHSMPATITVSRDGRRAYVVDQGGDSVATIDVLARSVVGTPQPVGFFPYGAALAGGRLLVTNEGLMRYGYTAQAMTPVFGYPPADRTHASSLSLLDLDAAGNIAPVPLEAGAAQAVVMDNPPDGIHAWGGAHPSAVAVTPDGAYAYVAMTGVDRIATVALAGTPRVVGGTELRLFDRGPYGTQPVSLALSRDGSTLYVALAGLDAVAVIDARDPAHLHRKGLIPTGWFPTALALSPDDASLYVVNTKGFGHDAGFSGDDADTTAASATWSTLEKIDLAATRLGDATLTTLKNARAIAGTRAPALPRTVRNVVVIEAPGATFDGVFGDLRSDWAAPQFAAGAAATPNLHALAQRYALALNFYADAEEADAGHQFLDAGEATAYTERAVLSKALQRTLFGADENPEDAARSGSIYDELARHRLSFRDYGDLVCVAGYDDGSAPDPRSDDPAFVSADDLLAPTESLGGRFDENVPVPAVLRGHVDENYPAWNTRIRDERRAAEFVRDYGALARKNRAPRYAQVVLSGSQPDADAAIGTIVAALSRTSAWRTTAVFITPVDALGGRDHVDAYRTYALVVSPWARPGYLGVRHLSTVSVLKTSEELLGLHPLSLGDLLASDMSDFFGTRPQFARYVAVAGLASPTEKASLSP
jgi:DNA-binding beta-propeller fold protein YncE